MADRYVTAIQRELELLAPVLEQRGIGSVYIGGGTPTTLNEDQLAVLLNSILRGAPNIAQDAEVTMEMNPVTSSRELFSLLREQGVTRLSIGVQSFSDDVLAVLGRAHRASEARQSFTRARQAGFTNIGMDLIYAIPGQTARHWASTLDEALALGPEHLSLYSLSLDRGSQFSEAARRGEFELPSDEAAADQYSTACQRLERSGYVRYELSNFARPGFPCRHNLNYWERGEYLGIGAGAWSFVDGVRSANVADIPAYLERIGSGTSARSLEERTGRSEAAVETLFLGLRTSVGVDLARFASDFGSASYESLLAAISKHRSTGLYEVEDGRLRLTQRGTLLADEATAALLP